LLVKPARSPAGRVTLFNATLLKRSNRARSAQILGDAHFFIRFGMDLRGLGCIFARKSNRLRSFSNWHAFCI